MRVIKYATRIYESVPLRILNMSLIDLTDNTDLNGTLVFYDKDKLPVVQ